MKLQRSSRESNGKSQSTRRTARTSAGAQSAPQALLPRRVPCEQQKQPIEVMRDPDVLRRLRGRLRDLSLAGIRSAAITTQDGELAGYAFVKADEVAERVSPLLARRIAACVDAVRAGTVISLEDGCPVT